VVSYEVGDSTDMGYGLVFRKNMAVSGSTLS
jgi:hypothetical protein